MERLQLASGDLLRINAAQGHLRPTLTGPSIVETRSAGTEGAVIASFNKMSLKELKLKTSIVKRYALALIKSISKELVSYQKEFVKQQERIAKLVSAGADDADIRKQVCCKVLSTLLERAPDTQNEVLKETEDMFPDVRRRLTKSHEELVELVDSLGVNLLSYPIEATSVRRNRRIRRSNGTPRGHQSRNGLRRKIYFKFLYNLDPLSCFKFINEILQRNQLSLLNQIKFLYKRE